MFFGWDCSYVLLVIDGVFVLFVGDWVVVLLLGLVLGLLMLNVVVGIIGDVVFVFGVFLFELGYLSFYFCYDVNSVYMEFMIWFKFFDYVLEFNEELYDFVLKFLFRCVF